MHSATLDNVSFITQFIRGLKLEIRDVVQCHMPPTMIKAKLLAKTSSNCKYWRETSTSPPRLSLSTRVMLLLLNLMVEMLHRSLLLFGKKGSVGIHESQ